MVSDKIKIIDYQSNNANNDFVDSLKNSGFAVLYNHQIDIDLINTVYKEWKDFFHSKEKFNYLFDFEKQDGYFPMKSENAKNCPIKDIKEFYHIYIPWGRIPDGLKENTLKIRSELKEVGLILLKWIDDLTPVDVKKNFSIPLQDMISGSESNLLRIIHYPPLREEDDKDAIRAAAHEDINLITLLVAGTGPGLEARDKDGTWHKIETDPGTIIINILFTIRCSSRFIY